MLLQYFLTLAVFVGLKSGLTPHVIWVLPALAVIWWRPAFRYGSAACAIGGIPILLFADLVDPNYYQSGHLIMMIPVFVILSPFTFIHDAALAKKSPNAYKISALGWFGWFSAGLITSVMIFYNLSNPSATEMHQAGVCMFATPICLYYFIKTLWTKKPQPTYSL